MRSRTERGHAIANLVAFEDGAGGGEGGGVGRGGAGADDVEIVADDVGEQQRLDAGRSGEAGQLSALDARDVFADGVDLVDGGAAGQQEPRGGLLLLERDAFGGQGQQGGGAAGDQADHQIVAAGRGGDFGDACGAGCAALIGHGWPHSLSSMRRSLARWPSLTLISPAVMRLAERALGGQRHGGSGLPCPDDVDIAEAIEIAAREVAGDGAGGVGRGEGGAEDGKGVAAEGLGGHGEVPEFDAAISRELHPRQSRC